MPTKKKMDATGPEKVAEIILIETWYQTWT